MDALIAAVEANAVLLAVLLPPAIRIAGHWLPEEPLMVGMGVLMAAADPPRATLLFVLLWASHSLTDTLVYALGRVLLPRLRRWPRAEERVCTIADRVAGSRWALVAFVPARILPLGRGAWLIGLGVARVSRLRFVLVDILAVGLHLLVWCGLGWWLGPQATTLLPAAKPAAGWLIAAVVASVAALAAWRRLTSRSQPGLRS